MDTSHWFDDAPVIGELPPEQAVAKLREIGEDDTADMLEMAQEAESKAFGFGIPKSWPPFVDKPWKHTTHEFGYLTPAQPGSDPLPIRPIGNIAADPSLKHARIKITLSRLRVVAYPGGGMHRVLLHFYAQNQVRGSKEDVHFNATYRVRDGEHAGIQGYPIFIGLGVGDEGLSFRCRTINVQNDQDEDFLNILESSVFKDGLHLINTVQPAIAPFSAIAYGLAEKIAKRNRNVSVQDFDLGLDFNNISMDGRLAEGSYLAVQVPENQQPHWNWQDWVYHPGIGQVVKRSDPAQLIPYNYLVFSISRYEGK